MTGSELEGRVRVQVLDRLEAVEPADFERVAEGTGLTVSRPYLLALEPDPALVPRYLVARDRRSRLLGLLPCYLWDGGRAPALDNYDPAVMGGGWVLGERSAPPEWRPTLFIGSRSGYLNQWLLHPGSRGDPGRALRPLLSRALALSRELGCGSVAAMWMTSEAAGQLAAALPVRERLMLGSGSAVVDLGFADFDGYLATLSSSRRHFVRRERARFAASGLTVSALPLSRCWQELARLAAPLQRKYGHGSSRAELEREFRRQADQLDRCSWVLLCRRGGRAVGFTLFYRWGEVLYGRAAGFDYPEVEGSAAYFNLAFYLPLEHALATHARQLHLGLASWQAKAMRGARLEPSWLWIVPPRRWRAGWARRLVDQPEGVVEWLRGQLGPAGAGLGGPGWERPSSPAPPPAPAAPSRGCRML